MRIVLVLLLPLAFAACRVAPLHRRGDAMVTIRAEHGKPLQGKSLAWDGGFDAENYTLTVQNHYFVTDRIALGAGLSASRWQLRGRHRWGGEVSLAGRWFFAELNELEEMGFFFDFTGGVLITDGNFPPNGTPKNFAFTFGPGLEFPITDTYSVLAAIQYHHISNALGRFSPRNPSQNELRFWIGVGILW